VNCGGKAVHNQKTMATPGYSGTPLLQKLGIKPEMKILLLNSPKDYSKLIEADITDQLVKKNDVPDLIHLFATNKKSFETEIIKLKEYFPLKPSIIIWISWYKKSSGIPTDITEDVIRNFALKNDLVDIKVCAVSDTWSGLKLVIQKGKRVKRS